MKIKFRKYTTLFASLVLITVILSACSEDESYESYDAEDYNKSGEYEPVETMNQDEINDELEDVLEDALEE